MGTKEPRAQGKGGAFKLETNDNSMRKQVGNRANLDRYGSLGHCVESVISAGAYISFGGTSDGGSVLIRVLDGDHKLSSYCHTDSEFMEAMEALETRYKRIAGKPTPLFAEQAPG